MKRRVAAFLPALLVAVLAVTIPWASPASAGDGEWTATKCFADGPANGAWRGTPGVGASYSSTYADYADPLQWITWNGKGQAYVQVLSETHAYYAAAGYECGRFGLPFRTGLYQSPSLTYRWTYFQRPGNCDMRYIMHVYQSGLTFEGVATDYFCPAA